MPRHPMHSQAFAKYPPQPCHAQLLMDHDNTPMHPRFPAEPPCSERIPTSVGGGATAHASVCVRCHRRCATSVPHPHPASSARSGGCISGGRVRSCASGLAVVNRARRRGLQTCLSRNCTSRFHDAGAGFHDACCNPGWSERRITPAVWME